MKTRILPVYGLIGIVAAVICGLFPNPASRTDPALFIYQTDTVLAVSMLIALHTALLMAILRPASHAGSWGRALLACVLCCGFLLLGAAGAMHAPPAWGAYTLWLLLLFAASIGLLIGAAGAGKTG
jgi:hypothetical protein